MADRGETFLARFRRSPLAVAGAGLIGVVVLAAVVGPWLWPYDPLAIDVDVARQGPGAAHWLGTDQLGRDILARVLAGAGVSLRVGVFSLALSLGLGIVVGTLAGMAGGWVDAGLMRLTDLSLAIPNLVAATVLITVFGRGEAVIWAVLGMLGWMSVARILRASVQATRGREFVDAARLAGCGPLRLAFVHVLPNSLGPVMVYAFNLVGLAVLAEAALSFLGLGVEAPKPSWGLMVAEGRSFLASAPHMVLAPSGALAITVAGFAFLGDGLRDVLDPRSR